MSGSTVKVAQCGLYIFMISVAKLKHHLYLFLPNKGGSNDAECINSARARDKSEIKKAFEWLKKHDSVRCPVAVSSFILQIIFKESDKK